MKFIHDRKAEFGAEPICAVLSELRSQGEAVYNSMDRQRLQAPPPLADILATGCGPQSSTRMDTVALTKNRNPEAAWYGVSWNERRQVLKYAGKGQVHPDQTLAEIARRWAEWRLRPRDRSAVKSAALGGVVALGEAAAGGVIGNLLAE